MFVSAKLTSENGGFANRAYLEIHFSKAAVALFKVHAMAVFALALGSNVPFQVDGALLMVATISTLANAAILAHVAGSVVRNVIVVVFPVRGPPRTAVHVVTADKRPIKRQTKMVCENEQLG